MVTEHFSFTFNDATHKYFFSLLKTLENLLHSDDSLKTNLFPLSHFFLCQLNSKFRISKKG